jgi:hypothetical protein
VLLGVAVLEAAAAAGVGERLDDGFAVGLWGFLVADPAALAGVQPLGFFD